METRAVRAVGQTFEPSVVDPDILKAFPYEYPSRETEMVHATDEFTSVCPFSGLPDFGTITIRYAPKHLCIELKSLKYYLFSYRQVRIYHEHVVNQILTDLIKLVQPRWMIVEGRFKTRGGIDTIARAEYRPNR
jgi:7-cyano-7-deazaguanine reductase